MDASDYTCGSGPSDLPPHKPGKSGAPVHIGAPTIRAYQLRLNSLRASVYILIAIGVQAWMFPLALASSPSIFGSGSVSIAQAGTVVSETNYFGAVYHNPAGLLGGDTLKAHLGYAYGGLQQTVDDTQAQGQAVSATIIGLSLPLPFKHALKDRVALGIAFHVPTNTVLTARVPAPGIPHFPILATRAQTVSLKAGIGLKLANNLSIGVSVLAMSGLTGAIDVGPNASGRIGAVAGDQLVARYAPILGAYWAVSESFHLGVAYRAQSSAEFDLPITADLGDDFPLQVPELTIRGVAQYDPETYDAELGWVSDPWRVNIGVRLSRWSLFPKPIEYAARPVEVARIPTPDWTNSWSPSLGIKRHWSVGGWAGVLHGGYRWLPTPVPSSQQTTAYLDNHRHILSMGHTFELQKLTLGFAGQIHQLRPRTTRSTPLGDTETTAYTHSGLVWLGMLELGLAL